MTTKDKLIDYFQYRLGVEMEKRRTARLVVQRDDADEWIGHYQRLIAKLQGEPS